MLLLLNAKLNHISIHTDLIMKIDKTIDVILDSAIFIEHILDLTNNTRINKKKEV